MQKLQTYFQQKKKKNENGGVLHIKYFYFSLTNNVVSFEQPGAVTYITVVIISLLFRISHYDYHDQSDSVEINNF